jgi:hypothetical protein
MRMNVDVLGGELGLDVNSLFADADKAIGMSNQVGALVDGGPHGIPMAHPVKKGMSPLMIGAIAIGAIALVAILGKKKGSLTAAILPSAPPPEYSI